MGLTTPGYGGAQRRKILVFLNARDRPKLGRDQPMLRSNVPSRNLGLKKFRRPAKGARRPGVTKVGDRSGDLAVRRDWQGEAEGGLFARRALGLDSATVGFDELLHDVQAQPHALYVP